MPPTPRPHARYDQHDVPTDRIENAAEAAVDQAMSSVLGSINSKLDQIIDRLAKGDTAITMLNHRVAFLEKIVYGMCSVVLLGVISALVALVVKSHP